MWGDRANSTVHAILSKLHEAGKSEDEIVNNVFSVVIGASVDFAQGLARSTVRNGALTNLRSRPYRQLLLGAAQL